MADTPELEVAGCRIEFMNGDGSYLVSVDYRTTQGLHWHVSDQFTFSTGAKLKKFISKTLLGGTDEETAAEEASGNT